MNPKMKIAQAHNYSIRSIRKHQLVDMVIAGEISTDMAQRIANHRGWDMDFSGYDNGREKPDTFQTMLKIARKYKTIDELGEELVIEEETGKFDTDNLNELFQ